MTPCLVSWGSHACMLEAGHDGEDHACDCCDCPDHESNEGKRVGEDGEEWVCVALPPYYGPGTQFNAPL